MATFIGGVTGVADFAVAADGLPSNEHLALRVMPLPGDRGPADLLYRPRIPRPANRVMLPQDVPCAA